MKIIAIFFIILVICPTTQKNFLESKLHQVLLNTDQAENSTEIKTTIRPKELFQEYPSLSDFQVIKSKVLSQVAQKKDLKKK